MKVGIRRWQRILLIALASATLVTAFAWLGDVYSRHRNYGTMDPAGLLPRDLPVPEMLDHRESAWESAPIEPDYNRHTMFFSTIEAGARKVVGEEGYAGLFVTVHRHRYGWLARWELDQRLAALENRYIPIKGSTPTFLKRIRGAPIDGRRTVICSSAENCDDDVTKHYLLQVGQYFVEVMYAGSYKMSEAEFIDAVVAVEEHIRKALEK